MNKEILGIGLTGIALCFFILFVIQSVMDIVNDPYMYVSNPYDMEPYKQTINISIPLSDLYIALFLTLSVIGGTIFYSAKSDK